MTDRAGENDPLRISGGGEPLHGRRILVTRSREQATQLVELLQGLGADVLQIPAIRIEPASDPDTLREAADTAGSFDWIVFTSVNGVERFGEAIEGGVEEGAIGDASVCAIGPATAEAATRLFGRVDLIAEVHTAEGVVEALESRRQISGRRFLLPQAAGARDVLAAGLREKGGDVVQVEAYRTVVDDVSGDLLRKELEGGGVDMVTFTSASSVRSVLELARGFLRGPAVATIGPVTSAAARAEGLNVDVEAEPHSIPGLIGAIVRFYSGGR
jgi:uroporphyrinogen III methyltransferase/synthase